MNVVLFNLNPAPVVGEAVVLRVRDGAAVGSMGKAQAEQNFISLPFSRSHIQRRHCKFSIDENGHVYCAPLDAFAVCFVNGTLVTDSARLKHNDRLILGSHFTFRVFVFGSEGPRLSKESTFEDACLEFGRNGLFVKNSNEAKATQSELACQLSSAEQLRSIAKYVREHGNAAGGNYVDPGRVVDCESVQRSFEDLSFAVTQLHTLFENSCSLSTAKATPAAVRGIERRTKLILAEVNMLKHRFDPAIGPHLETIAALEEDCCLLRSIYVEFPPTDSLLRVEECTRACISTQEQMGRDRLKALFVTMVVQQLRGTLHIHADTLELVARLGKLDDVELWRRWKGSMLEVGAASSDTFTVAVFVLAFGLCVDRGLFTTQDLVDAFEALVAV